jgi:hypothetical protein
MKLKLFKLKEKKAKMKIKKNNPQSSSSVSATSARLVFFITSLHQSVPHTIPVAQTNKTRATERATVAAI